MSLQGSLRTQNGWHAGNMPLKCNRSFSGPLEFDPSSLSQLHKPILQGKQQVQAKLDACEAASERAMNAAKYAEMAASAAASSSCMRNCETHRE